MKRILGWAIASALIVNCAPAAGDFSGLYHPSNWQFLTNGDGSLVDNSPASVTINGAEVLTPPSAATLFLFPVTQSLLLSFDWSFTSTGGLTSVFFSSPGAAFFLTNTPGQSGSISNHTVEYLGDPSGVFGWNLSAFEGNGAGRGSLTISNFSATAVPVIPEPAMYVLFALGMGVLLVSQGYKRRKPR